MPFAGPNDQGAVIAQSYLAGRQSKMSRQRAAQVKKLEDADLELRKAAQEQAKRQAEQRMNIESSREERYAMESAQNMGMAQNRDRRDQSQETREQQSFDLTKQNLATAKADDKGLADVQRFGLDAYASAHPELAEDVKAGAAVIGTSGLSDLARGKAYQLVHAQLKEKAEALGQQKVTQGFQDMLQVDALSGNVSEGPEFDELQQKIGDPSVSSQEKAKAITAFRIKSVKQNAEAQNLQFGAMTLQTQLDGLGLQPGSEEYGAGMRAIESQKHGLLTFAQSQEQIEKIRTAKMGGTGPKPSDIHELAKSLHEDALMADPNARFIDSYRQAQAELSPQAPTQEQPINPNVGRSMDGQRNPVDAAKPAEAPFSKDEAALAQKFFAENPQGTDAELEAYIASGGKKSLKSKPKDGPSDRAHKLEHVGPNF